MATYDYRGHTIAREPIPRIDDVTGAETTGWQFCVFCSAGKPLPVIVEAVNRREGLKEARLAVDRLVAETAAQADSLSA